MDNTAQVFEIDIVKKKNVDRMIGNEFQNRFELVYVQRDYNGKYG